MAGTWRVLPLGPASGGGAALSVGAATGVALEAVLEIALEGRVVMELSHPNPNPNPTRTRTRARTRTPTPTPTPNQAVMELFVACWRLLRLQGVAPEQRLEPSADFAWRRPVSRCVLMHPACSPMRPPCSPTRSACSPTRPACSPTHPRLQLHAPSLQPHVSRLAAASRHARIARTRSQRRTCVRRSWRRPECIVHAWYTLCMVYACAMHMCRR